MRWFLVSLALAGCASAGKGNSIIGGIEDAGIDDAGVRIDGNDVPEIDASLIDAPPSQVTLSQTTSTAITSNNSLACVPDTPEELDTRPNSYYRVFAMADDDIRTALHVTEVTFGIQDAISATADDVQPATVRIGVYEGAIGSPVLDLSRVRGVAEVDILIADSTGTRMTVPISGDVPAASNLIVELEIPANATVRHRFFIGSNDGGERRPGYFRAPTCDFREPTTLSSISPPPNNMDILISVTGTH
jgi:hypothetical protein